MIALSPGSVQLPVQRRICVTNGQQPARATRRAAVMIRSQLTDGKNPYRRDVAAKAAAGTAGSVGNRPVDELPLPEGSLRSYLPVVGEMFEYLRKGPLQFGQEKLAKYGPVCRISAMGAPTYMVGDWETIETALLADNQLTAQTMPSKWFELIGNMLSRGTSTALKRQTAAITSPSALGKYSEELEEITSRHFGKAVSDGQFDLHTFATEITVDFALQLVCGLKIADPEIKERIRVLVPKLILGVYAPVSLDLPGLPYHEGKKAKKELEAIFRPYVADLQKQVEELVATKQNGNNFMLALMKAKVVDGETINDEIVFDAMLTMLVAGNDTSSAALTGIIAMMGYVPPETIEKLREEQRRIVAKHGEALSGAALAEMEYAYAFAREALRLFNIVTMLDRLVIKDFEVHGRRIPAGSKISLNFMVANAKDPQVLTGAKDKGLIMKTMTREVLLEAFNPDRWLEDPKKLPRLTTFGYGPHFCLGYPLFMLEAKAVLAKIARNYVLETPGDAMEWDITFLPRPKEKTTMKIQPLGTLLELSTT